MLSIHSLFKFSFSSSPIDWSRDLQHALQDKNVTSAALEKILSSHLELLRQPLPNGDLPLHYAVKESHLIGDQELSKVKVLLRLGAEVDQKDDHGFTALDHAVMLRNERLLSALLSIKIGQEMQDIQAQIEQSDDTDYLHTIVQQQNALKWVDPKELNSLQHAAYTGDLSQFSLGEMIEAPVDSQGLKPIHYAIKGKQTELVKLIVAEMQSRHLDINILDIFEHNLLHFAVASEALDMIEILAQAGLDLNRKNTRGETALHYGATQENLRCFQTLIRAGADPKRLDAGGRSPLAIYSAIVLLKDPLRVNNVQLMIFASTALYWLAHVASSSGWQIPYYNSLITIGLFLASSYSEFSGLLTHLDKNWKKVFAFVSYFAWNYVPVVNFIYPLWRTTYVMQEAFHALKASWNNIRYRKWDTACKLVVTTTNTASAVHTLYRRFESNKYLYDLFVKVNDLFARQELYEDFQDLYKDFEFLLRSSSHSRTEYYLHRVLGRLMHLMEEMSGQRFAYPQNTPQECSPIDSKALAALSLEERLSFDKLKLQCPAHAAMILSSEFDREQFCKEVAQATHARQLHYLSRVYRAISHKIHPDKHPDPRAAEWCFKIQQAKEKLEQELNQLDYCK